MRVERVYTPVAPDEGTRVEVDRLWPRGIRKDDPRVGTWMPHVAPSAQLRTWYGHDESRWEAFCDAYEEELATQAEARDALAHLKEMVAAGPVTLTTATADVEHAHVQVLARLLAG